jgi:GR25 family glycosyltransferase involved in LPS biosynthesis
MVGCFLSHLDLYKTVTEGTKPYGLIFEDDANVDPQIYDKTIRHLGTTIPPDWDIILLGYFDYDKTHDFVQLDTCKKALSFWGTHGYIVNRASAQKMQSLMQPPFSAQIDYVMSKLSREDNLNVYAINQPVVWQNAKYSDVQAPDT